LRLGIRYALALLAVCWAVPSSAAEVVLKESFHKAAPPSGAVQTHMKVGLLVTPEFSKRAILRIGQHATAQTSPAFENALSRALSSLFEVQKIPDREAQTVQGLDLLLQIRGYDRKHVRLTFYEVDAGWLAEVRDFVRPLSPELKGIYGLEKQLSETLQGLVSDIASDKELLGFAAKKQAAREWAQKAATAGKASDLQGAFSNCVEAVAVAWPGTMVDVRCRRGLVQLAGTLPKPPVLPAEARRRMERGKILVKNARNPADMKAAATEMERAVSAAPWWADGYYNLGLVEANVGSYAPAIRHLNFYLAANPSAPEAAAVKNKIYELELRKEKKIAP